MRRWFEGLESFAIDVILGRRYGRRADALRGLLWMLSLVYLLLVQTRLWLYRNRIYRSHSHGCLVISVGNLSVGGTGKTPVVELLAKALQQGGRRVAILSRGYKSVPRPFLLRLQGRTVNRLARSAARFPPAAICVFGLLSLIAAPPKRRSSRTGRRPTRMGGVRVAPMNGSRQ